MLCMNLRRASKRALLALAALVGGACDASSPTRPAPPVPIPVRDDAPVQTDALDYELQYGSGPRYAARAVVTYRNDTPATVYFDRLSGGDGPLLFELTPAWPGSFGVAVSQIFIGTGSIAIAVAPGQTLVETVTLELQDIDQPTSQPRFVGSSGVLRMRLRAYSRINDFGEADHSSASTELVSNAFRVRFIR